VSQSLEFHVTILASGIWPPVPESELRLGGLELLLARGDFSHIAPASLEALLFENLGAEVPSGDLPVAAVTRVLDLGVVDQEWWIRADPVHLSAQRDALVLVPGALIDIRREEAESLCAELAASYATEGWLLRAPHPWRWYLRPPHIPDVQTTPLARVAGRDIHPWLPEGADARAWRTLLNEMQILLHTSRANGEREARGALPINSLWFWGGGRLPRVTTPVFDQVWADDTVARALCRLSGTVANAVPEGFEAWRGLARPGRHLIVLDSVRSAMQRDAQAGWSVALAHLDKAWFVPFTAALRSRDMQELRLVTDHGLASLTTPGKLGRWWRRRRPLSDLAGMPSPST